MYTKEMAQDYSNNVDARRIMIEERFAKTLFPIANDQLLFDWEEDLNG